MMTVRFTKDCHDRYTGECYKAGTTKQVSNKRGAEMLLSSFVELVEDVKPVEDKPKKTRKKKED